MARHASGKNNYSLSTGAVAVLVAAALIIASLVWFFTGRGNDDTNAQGDTPDCVAGELALPVAASDRTAGQALIDAYSATNPVVRDYCVTPELVPDLASAAVYVAPYTPVTKQHLENSGRTAAIADPEAVFSESVGVVGASAADVSALNVADVRFPVGEEPAASALVASQLAGNDNDAVKALTDQRIATLAEFQPGGEGEGVYAATAADSVPGGLEFTPLDADVVFTAVPLNQNDRVDENQARAGQDFARSAAERFDGSVEDQPVISELVWAAALPAGGEGLTGGPSGQAGERPARDNDTAKAAGAVEPANTLFLLDTSEQMAPYMQGAEEGIAQAAEAVAAAGNRVALWNYSSPLNPGVVKGYRQNVDMTPDGEAVAASVRRFLTGGVPQTREAVQAAVAAYAGAAPLTRVVLVTTGTADAGDDAAFSEQVRQAAGESVEIAVVHIGDAEIDPALVKLAANQVEADAPEAIVAAVREAAGV